LIESHIVVVVWWHYRVSGDKEEHDHHMWENHHIEREHRRSTIRRRTYESLVGGPYEYTCMVWRRIHRSKRSWRRNIDERASVVGGAMVI
jgi:hypothetical protein